MTKEDKQWLKENEPWGYGSCQGDPVTGRTDSGSSGFAEVFFIFCIGLGIWGLINLIGLFI